jgi:oligopeptide transport system ATP-binding protein
MHIPPGCPFHPRCRYAQDVCRADPPPLLREIRPARHSACHFAELLAEGPHIPEQPATSGREEQR